MIWSCVYGVEPSVNVNPMLIGAVMESFGPTLEGPVHCVESKTAAVCVDGSTQLYTVGACA